MSTDPNSGVGLVEMFDNVNGSLTDGERFTGVLISPDEILTVAHGVTNTDGTFRNSGAIYLGQDGTSLSGEAVGISSVHAVDGSHPSGGMENDAQVATDFAVIHLDKPVTDAQVFSLGTGAAGTYTMTGYPALDGYSRASVTEALTAGNANGELQGASIVGSGDAEGASGGPVWSMVNGTPTVSGLVVAGDNATKQYMLSLTATDITQIDAWVASDDAVATTTPTPVATPIPVVTTTPVGSTSTSGSGSTGFVVSPPAPTDRLDQLANLLGNASSSASGAHAIVMSDVASSLAAARQDGYTGSDLADSADDAASWIGGNSSLPKRALAFMAGMMASESGVKQGRAMAYIANAFGLDVDPSMKSTVMAGYKQDQSFLHSSTAAPVSVSDLGQAIGASMGGTGLDATTAAPAVSVSAMLARPAHA